MYFTVSLLNTACCEKINGDDNDADDDELRIKAILIQTVDYYAAKSSLINFIIALILIDLNNFYRPTVVAWKTTERSKFFFADNSMNTTYFSLSGAATANFFKILTKGHKLDIAVT